MDLDIVETWDILQYDSYEDYEQSLESIVLLKEELEPNQNMKSIYKCLGDVSKQGQSKMSCLQA